MIFSEHVGFWHAPTYQEVARDLVLIFVRGERIDVSAGNDDRFGPDAIKPPRFVEATKHVLVNAWEGNQAADGNYATRQNNNGIIRFRHARIDERSVAGFERIAKPISQETAVKHNDQTKRH